MLLPSICKRTRQEIYIEVLETIQDLLGDEETLEIFIGSLALREVGFSVPRSARHFLSVARMRLGFLSLNEIDSMGKKLRVMSGLLQEL